MERNEILRKLTSVFRKVFDCESIVIYNEMTAKDVDHWDSLTHMILITEIEKTFTIKFKLKDLNKMKNVGEMIDVLDSKL